MIPMPEALLALPSGRLRPMHRRRGLWSAVNIACGVAILFGAALMHAIAKT
jgi:hypothetical protein